MGFHQVAPRTSFGSLLRSLRRRLGMSLETFARLVGRSHTDISRIESGQRKPPAALMAAWADALRLTGSQRDDFLAMAGLMHVPEELREVVRSSLHREGVWLAREHRRKHRPANPADEMVTDEQLMPPPTSPSAPTPAEPPGPTSPRRASTGHPGRSGGR